MHRSQLGIRPVTGSGNAEKMTSQAVKNRVRRARSCPDFMDCGGQMHASCYTRGLLRNKITAGCSSVARCCPTRLGWPFPSRTVSKKPASTHPVEVVIEYANFNRPGVVSFGSDGATSHVRRCIGQIGDGEWQGVLDARVISDHQNQFPTSTSALSTPRTRESQCSFREANSVRFYVQLQTSEGARRSPPSHTAQDKVTQDIFTLVDLEVRILWLARASLTDPLDRLSLAMKGLGEPEVLLPSYEQELLHFDVACIPVAVLRTRSKLTSSTDTWTGDADGGWESGPPVARMNGAFRIHVFVGDLLKTKALSTGLLILLLPSFNRHRVHGGVLLIFVNRGWACGGYESHPCREERACTVYANSLFDRKVPEVRTNLDEWHHKYGQWSGKILPDFARFFGGIRVGFQG
ncbi:hypothetical protein FB45DRAFT_860096 [Roridomyces roridus]|uniref:Uncharacterized protein n=1 Tax=Roridomyces roridus TaxID=1738132 RepID=A0AAD7FVY3_9AGAR|nr:hypothetical protein FB45DRAFT_860096 [Roridomyces roridus]